MQYISIIPIFVKVHSEEENNNVAKTQVFPLLTTNTILLPKIMKLL